MSTRHGTDELSVYSLHTPLAQSLFSAQHLSAAHAAHDPPQSTPTSSPLRAPSLQVGATHVPAKAML